MEKSSDAFRTISEVADDLDLPQHVLRFWETRFSHIRPLKRAGGRRYYRPADVVLLRTIRALLYDQGYTIKGVQRLLKEHGPRGLAPDVPPPPVDLSDHDTMAGEPFEVLDQTSDTVGATGQSAPHSTPEVMPSHLAAYDQDVLLDMLALIEECTRILETARRPSI